MNIKEKHIALFVPSLRGGGAERVMINLARGFMEQDFRVDIVLSKAEGPYLSHIPDNVRMIDLKSSRVIASLPNLVRYLKQEEPKILISALDHANIVAIWAKKLAKVPTRTVISVHSTMSKSIASDKSLRAKLIPYCARLFYPMADTVIAVSNGVAEDLIRITGVSNEKIKVIYNPVIMPELFEKANEALEHPWFKAGEPPVILGVGRLTAAKDFSTLIRAFDLIRRERPARLMILGEGEERSKLEALIRELGIEKDTDLPGFVENPYKYMKRAAVFVLSSKWEGFGNALAEAMALGTPVVSTDCENGPSEILEEGKWGKLVPVGDIKSLSKAIIKSLDEKRGIAIKRAQYFSLEEITYVYRKVLGI